MTQDRNTRQEKNAEYEAMYKNTKSFPISDLDGNKSEVEYDMAEQEIGDLEPQPKRTRGKDKKPRKRRKTKSVPMSGEQDVEYDMTENEIGDLVPEPKGDGRGRGKGQMKKDGTGKGNGRGKDSSESLLKRLKALGYMK